MPQICGHQLFETQVAHDPDAVALVFGQTRMSYRELNERANRVAHFLRRSGVGPDVLVGICLRRSPAMAVAMLAVWKAGGAYVPMDPEYPPERLSFMIAGRADKVTADGGKLPATSGWFLRPGDLSRHRCGNAGP